MARFRQNASVPVLVVAPRPAMGRVGSTAAHCNAHPDSTAQDPGFNYTDLAASLRPRVHEETAALRSLARRDISGLLESGRRLLAVWELIGRDHFQAWLTAEVPISQPGASRCMCVARAFPSLDHPDRFRRGALYALASPSVPAAAREAALRRARAGETIDLAAAQAIIAEHSATAEPGPALVAPVVARFLKGLEATVGRFAPGDLDDACRQLAAAPARLRAAANIQTEYFSPDSQAG